MHVAKFKDYYAVLGVAPRAHARVIEETYWSKAHELHQHLHRAPTKKLQKKLTQLNEAYEILGAPQKRSAYDRKRSEAFGEPTAREYRPSVFESVLLVVSKPFRPD